MAARSRLSRALLCACLLLLSALGARAQEEARDRGERILRFHSDIEIEADGAMLVTETIRVVARGEQIRRGIFRDFPTRYQDRFGNQYRVGFDVLEVRRDGEHEPYSIESLSNGERVYIGHRERFLAPGEYFYTLRYRTTRQLGFFAQHDELYWNVTGTGWDFPIEQASATVRLPFAYEPGELGLEGYTGVQGSTERSLSTGFDQDGLPTFTATRPLGAREGLTIVLTWPKGRIPEPTGGERFTYFLEDNLGTLIGGAGLLAVFLYYFLAWVRVGRDPAPGVIMPLYEPPRGYSPAALRFLNRMKFDHKAFAAAVLSLAVKGRLAISEAKGAYTLERKGGHGGQALDPDEARLLNKLFPSGSGSLALKQENHAKVSGAIEELKSSLRHTLEKTYFLTNRRYMIPGLALTAVFVIATAAAQPAERAAMGLFMLVWLSGWSVGVIFLLTHVGSLWKAGLGGGGAAMIGAALFMTMFALPFVAGEVAGLVMLTIALTPLGAFTVASMVALNFLFYELLRAPTAAGRALLDKVEGFKMFLEAVDGHRISIMHRPEKTPELFEKYLPYALALDLEQAWAAQFADVLARAGQPGQQYSPAWYSGTRALSAIGPSAFAGSFGSSFTGAIAASSTAPGSSSGSSSGGGGGGSSGGGGGGGGGGGW
jgi:uncharacterized membrane protein YgcG